MTCNQLTGCCQILVLSGFGNTHYDGSRSIGMNAAAFEAAISQHDSKLLCYSSLLLTINDEQYVHYGSSLAKLGWKLINTANSLGHPTVVFTYIKNSPKVSEEIIKSRLTNRGIKL